MSHAPAAQEFWTPSLQAFRAYAALTGDDNPIHLDPDFASRHPFGRVVCHGMLLHARLCALAEAQGLGPGRASRIVFPAPAYADEELHLTLAHEGQALRARAARRDGTLVYDALWLREPADADR